MSWLNHLKRGFRVPAKEKAHREGGSPAGVSEPERGSALKGIDEAAEEVLMEKDAAEKEPAETKSETKSEGKNDLEKDIQEEGTMTEEIMKEAASEAVSEVASEAASKEESLKGGSLKDRTDLQEKNKEKVKERDPLEALEPSDVFGYFRAISAVPHGSYHTRALSEYLEEFARGRGLSCVRDEAGNLIITRQASPGFEGAEPVALQGHIDMVCEKELSKKINMETDPISLRTDGEWLWADGTTLGGDDGVGVAIMMALLANDSIKCPPLECIFTVDEEVGLLGAHAIDLSSVKSRRMINLDSEEEGLITAGCAGGAEEICTLPGRRREKKGVALEILVDGLRGGHSGETIGAGRANANLLLARLLYLLEEKGKYCLVSFAGGVRDNAIPRSARAEIIFTGDVSKKEVKSAVTAFSKEVKKEFELTDPDIRIRSRWTGRKKEEKGPATGREEYQEAVRETEKKKKELRIAFTRSDTRRMIRFLMAMPNGVIEYFPHNREIPRTSLSMGIVKTMADGIQINSLVRSNLDSQLRLVQDRIDCIAEAFGASVETRGAYPAWELASNSPFRDLAVEVYDRVTGRQAAVQVIHAGLECGILAAKIPGLECISIGPDTRDIHTPSERLDISSTGRTYEYVKALLAACAQQ